MKLINFAATLLTIVGFAHGPSVSAQDLSTLLANFQAEQDVSTKEQILRKVTQGYPDAGEALLTVASSADNSDTTWLAIRGIGTLRFKAAVPFLTQSLTSKVAYVRSNAARALGEIGNASATRPLMQALKVEEDGGAIEQMSLALRMLHAAESVPVLKTKAEHRSIQTRIWIIQAIADLGTKRDALVLAKYLDDESVMVAEQAVEGLGNLTGEDFGFVPCTSGPCAGNTAAVQKAKVWRGLHRDDLDQR